MLQAAFEHMLAWAHHGERARDLVLARAEYVTATGDLFEGDAAFERRTDALLEWFALERCSADGFPPIVHYAQAMGEALPAEQRAALDIWRQSRLSLFEIGKQKGTRRAVGDLLTGGSHDLLEAAALVGLQSGDLLVARLLPLPAGALLSDGLCILPAASGRAIRMAAKKLRKQGATPAEQLRFILNMVYFANRCERYRHVKPKDIFAACLAR